MRRAAAVLLLAGCAAGHPEPDGGLPDLDGGRPERVIVYTDTLTVETADGSLCVGGGLAGRTRGCPWSHWFTLKERPGGPRSPLRRVDRPGILTLALGTAVWRFDR